MVQIVWSERAKRSLAKVHDFIAENDTKAAQRIVREILGKAAILSRLPYLGAIYRDGKYPGIRVLLQGRYRIFYEIRGEDIRVHGVYHERMDVRRHLRIDPKP